LQGFSSNECSQPAGELLHTVTKGKDNLYHIPHCLKKSAFAHYGTRTTQTLPEQIWHDRLGHINKRDLQRLPKPGTSTGIFLRHEAPFLPSTLSPCESCVLSKIAKAPFSSSRHKTATHPFEIVLSDICGPFLVPSLAGSRYFISFIDKKSRFAYVYFLKHKSQGLDSFRKFDAIARRKTGPRIHMIETLHTDNGGEYLSQLFRSFCEQQGITQETTVPYSPQQNAIAKRFNRTMQEIGNSIRHKSGLGREFWG
jgi:transposase InsO family protein